MRERANTCHREALCCWLGFRTREGNREGGRTPVLQSSPAALCSPIPWFQPLLLQSICMFYLFSNQSGRIPSTPAPRSSWFFSGVPTSASLSPPLPGAASQGHRYLCLSSSLPLHSCFCLWSECKAAHLLIFGISALLCCPCAPCMCSAFAYARVAHLFMLD